MGPSSPRGHHADAMGHEEADEQPSGDAMNKGADGVAVGQHVERPTEESVGELVDEAGVHEGDEKDHEGEVLSANESGHPHLDFSGIGQTDMGAELLEVVERVVGQHAADGQDDDDDVDAGDEEDDPVMAIGHVGRGVETNGRGGEPGADAGVALAAGLRQVRLVDGGQRVAGWQDVMDAVTGGAVGDRGGAELEREPVEALHVALHDLLGQTVARGDALRGVALAAGLWDVSREDLGSGRTNGRDGVFAVAIGAGGGIALASLDGLAVHAAEVGLADVFVALAASGGDGLPEQFGGGIRPFVEVVRAMAVRAHRGLGDAFFEEGHAMHALLVGDNRPTLPKVEFLHLVGVSVAVRAGPRNVGSMDRRVGVAVVQQLVRLAMAILAGGRLMNALMKGTPVVALRIDLGLDAVTLAATDRLEALSVGYLLDVHVAARAQVLGMDGRLVFRLVHVHGDGLAVRVLLDQLLVVVAGQAVVIGDRLRPGPVGESQKKAAENGDNDTSHHDAPGRAEQGPCPWDRRSYYGSAPLGLGLHVISCISG